MRLRPNGVPGRSRLIDRIREFVRVFWSHAAFVFKHVLPLVLAGAVVAGYLLDLLAWAHARRRRSVGSNQRHKT